MTAATKFIIPPLVPSAEERLQSALNAAGWTGPKPAVLPHITRVIESTHRDGYLAGIDAVIALLREPSNHLKAVAALEGLVGMGPTEKMLRALADELERRKP